MTEKVDKKTLRNDLILILSLFVIAAVWLVKEVDSLSMPKV